MQTKSITPGRKYQPIQILSVLTFNILYFPEKCPRVSGGMCVYAQVCTCVQ